MSSRINIIKPYCELVALFLVKNSMLRQSDVARILGVSHQRVSQLRLRHRIEFTWNQNLRAWVTTEQEVKYFLARRTRAFCPDAKLGTGEVL